MFAARMMITIALITQFLEQTLYTKKTWTEVIDEIWYNVKHLEPWEPGSRKVRAHLTHGKLNFTYD